MAQPSGPWWRPWRRPALASALLVALVWIGSAVSAMRERPGSGVSAPALGPNDFALTAAAEPVLFSQLEQGDLAWLPRAEPIPGGGTRYLYKRRAGDPPLTVEQIKRLMLAPPRFAMERASIEALLNQLRAVGVTVVLGPPRKAGAAGEWQPRHSLLRIRPDVPGKGSAEFVRVLNHEAIHVAQSCRGGSIRSAPAPLGLSRWLREDLRRHLAEPIYAKASPLERRLEEEAYANQERLSLGSQLLLAHCRR